MATGSPWGMEPSKVMGRPKASPPISSTRCILVHISWSPWTMRLGTPHRSHREQQVSGATLSKALE
eukprot:11114087-Alexandrium_andersonii.AAC.1